MFIPLNISFGTHSVSLEVSALAIIELTLEFELGKENGVKFEMVHTCR